MRNPLATICIGLSAIGLVAAAACTGRTGTGAPRGECPGASWPDLTGDYLGQTPPGDRAELFAPGLISTGVYTRDVAMTPDGNEFYFCAVLGNHDWYGILVTRRVDGTWTEPRVAPFSGRYKDMEPTISPDGRRFLFMSFRPKEEGKEESEDSDLWAMDRVGDGWGEPYNLGPPVNSERSEFFPSVTSDGTIYFTREGEGRTNDILRSRLVGESYAEPERLGPAVNSGPSQFNAFVAPDESYLIFGTVREDSLGGGDHYVSFRDENDRWTGPINLGPEVNSPAVHEWSAFVSRDGKYLFFMSSRSRFADGFPAGPLTYSDIRRMHSEPAAGLPGIYWIDASVIEDLRP
jgi:hypothetical protein